MLPLDAFRPQAIDRLYVLGGTADVSRVRAEQLMRPLEWIDLGKRLGAAAAAEAAALEELAEVRLPSQANEFEMVAGKVRESLTGVRPIQQLPAIELDSRPLPVRGFAGGQALGLRRGSGLVFGVQGLPRGQALCSVFRRSDASTSCAVFRQADDWRSRRSARRTRLETRSDLEVVVRGGTLRVLAAIS